MQYGQVFLSRLALVVLLAQGVVGHSEVRCREQAILITVVLKRARLTHQPIDDVTIVDQVLVATSQTRELIHTLLRVPDLDVIHVDAGFDLLANQAAVNRIRIPPDLN